MNKRIINIVASVVMLVSFFQPWINFFGYGGSPFQAVKEVFKNLKFIEKEPLILLTLLLLIFPICAVVILSYYAKQGIKEKDISKINTFKKTPLIFIIIVIIYGFVKMGEEMKMLGEINISEIIGIGLILNIISSIVLFFDKTTAMNFVQNNSSAEEQKEDVNTDDLFK